MKFDAPLSPAWSLAPRGLKRLMKKADRSPLPVVAVHSSY